MCVVITLLNFRALAMSSAPSSPILLDDRSSIVSVCVRKCVNVELYLKSLCCSYFVDL